MAKKAKYNVEDKNSVGDLKWDDLIPLYEDTSKSLQTGINALKETGETFKEIIDEDPEIAKIHVGIAKTFSDLTKELTDIVKVHSKEVYNEKLGKSEYRPFVGPVDTEDPKHQEVYLYTIMAYGGINDKIVSVVENTTVTLLGSIKEATAKLEKMTDDAIKDKGE